MTADQGVLRLSKHEGAGNDFLVLVDVDERAPLDAPAVRALCHRHLGIGADGVLRIGPGRDGAPISMDLWNSDGSIGAMSGNGIRCLVQAAVDAGLAAPPEVPVATMAGVRLVTYEDRRPVGWGGVDMGMVGLGEDRSASLPGVLAGAPARLADVGNRHLVVIVPDAASPEAWAEAPGLVASVPGGVNVELVSVEARDGAPSLALRVLERGAGETRSCGTGSCAAAAVAHAFGLTGDRVAVRNPGGVLDVTLAPADGPGAAAHLAGPVRRVARIEVDLADLEPVMAALGGGS